MKPVYLSPAQWQAVHRCIQQKSEFYLAKSEEAGDNKEKRDLLFDQSERWKRMAADIHDQITD